MMKLMTVLRRIEPRVELRVPKHRGADIRRAIDAFKLRRRWECRKVLP